MGTNVNDRIATDPVADADGMHVFDFGGLACDLGYVVDEDNVPILDAFSTEVMSSEGGIVQLNPALGDHPAETSCRYFCD